MHHRPPDSDGLSSGKRGRGPRLPSGLYKASGGVRPRHRKLEHKTSASGKFKTKGGLTPISDSQEKVWEERGASEQVERENERHGAGVAPHLLAGRN